MTPSEVETCLRDFNASHKVMPVLLVAGDDIYRELMLNAHTDDVTGKAWFAGVQVLSDPLIKGIVVSS